MGKYFGLVILTLLGSCALTYAQNPGAQFIIQMNDDNFDLDMRKQDYILVAIGDMGSETFETFKPKLDQIAFDFILHMPRISVGLVDSSANLEVAEEQAVENDLTLIFYQGLTEQGRYDGALETQDVENWVYSFTDAIPEVREFGLEDLTTAFGQDIASIFLLRGYHDVEADFVKEFRKASQYYGADEILFYCNDIIQDVQMQLGLQLGADPSDLPMIVIAKGLDSFHYAGDAKTITVNNIKDFIKDYKNGKIDPYIKQQKIADVGEQTNGVVNVVRENFKDLVMENEQDVIVKFYASWCPHCIEMKKKWEELAKKFNELDIGVVIAELEAPKNDIPGIAITSYPTIYLFRAGQKTDVLDYDGPSEVDAWDGFLGKYSPKYMAYLEEHPDELPEVLKKKEEEIE